MADDVSLVVLPGGSPASLRTVLSGRVQAGLLEMRAAGAGISGASAGAMVLCSRMVRLGRAAGIVDGLGLVNMSSKHLSSWSTKARTANSTR